MRAGAVTLFASWLFSTPDTQSISPLLEKYSEHEAPYSTTLLLARLAELPAAEAPVARFLLANDLAELGLGDPAKSLFRSLLPSPTLGPAAFTSLVRQYSEAKDDELLLREIEAASWELMKEEDFVEAAYRVTQACLRTGRYAEARIWSRSIPRGSPHFPFARYLLAQSEYALGFYGGAVGAAEPIFSRAEPTTSIEWLQDRTAVWLGETSIDLGLYGRTIRVLSRITRGSPYGDRTRRGLSVARVLGLLKWGEFDRAEAEAAGLLDLLDTYRTEVAEAVGSEEELAVRIDDLKTFWPPRERLLERRRWAARRAAESFEWGPDSGLRRVAVAARETLPPVILYRLARSLQHLPWRQPIPSSATRFFFPPDRELSRALLALSLVDRAEAGAAPAGGGEDADCRRRAARALSSRIASFLVGQASPPTLPELVELSRGCGTERSQGLRPLVEQRVRHSILAEARKLQSEIRRLRWALDRTMARAQLGRWAAVRRAGGSPRSASRGFNRRKSAPGFVGGLIKSAPPRHEGSPTPRTACREGGRSGPHPCSPGPRTVEPSCNGGSACP